jgi:hypothetical protein
MHAKPEEKERTVGFTRNSQLEKLMITLNEALQCAESKVLAKSFALGMDYPLVFVMGPLRSGTTLFMQLLANSGVAACPTNLLSRFYGAPVVGAQIQLLLTDPRYNFRNEILDFNSPITYFSENGKTKGALAPNEFWYFWRRFLPFQELDWMSDEELFRVVDKEKLVGELTALTRVFGKPFALKSMILNYNIPFLDSLFKKALFVHIKRDPVANVASILDARKRQLGSEKEWYSFKIPEYPQLKDLDPITQSAGQLYYINKAISRGMETLDESRRLAVQYEELCKNPRSLFEQLAKKVDLKNSKSAYSGPDRFSPSRATDLPSRTAIEKALAAFELQ